MKRTSMPVARAFSLAAALFLALGACARSAETGAADEVVEEGSAAVRSLRVAVFNVEELSTEKLVQVDGDGAGVHPQARAAARIIQRVRPDILVLNEIDQDHAAVDRGLDLNARRFAAAYLATGDNPIEYPYVFTAPCNTGILSGVDLNNDGNAASDSERGDPAYGDDSFGFGLYPGQYSMAVLSRFPIDAEGARTFQRFLWKDLPGNHIPPGYFKPEARAVFRLSSKSHWDVPVQVGDSTLHLFVSHPTPPVFDGDEDRNGRRNFDEIKFWVEYLDNSSGGEALHGEALYDDEGNRGGFGSDAPFIILGDLNAYPDSQESVYDGLPAIAQLLDHPRIQDTGETATSRGALVSRGDYPGGEPGPPRFQERATATWAGGVRVDYVLPSTNLIVRDGGVFWPTVEEDAEGNSWAEQASDHHLVWVDVSFKGK